MLFLPKSVKELSYKATPLRCGGGSTNNVMPNPLTNGNIQIADIYIITATSSTPLHLQDQIIPKTANMSRPVLSSATRHLQQSTAHCQRPFSTTRFFAALSEPITRSSSIYDTNANSLHALTRPSRHILRKVNISPFGVRAFSSSTIRPSAKVVQNAKNDEEGKPLMVGISERAAEVRFI